MDPLPKITLKCGLNGKPGFTAYYLHVCGTLGCAEHIHLRCVVWIRMALQVHVFERLVTGNGAIGSHQAELITNMNETQNYYIYVA